MLMEYIKRLKNLKIELPYDPATPLLGVYKKFFKKAWNTNTKIYMHANVQSSNVYNYQNMEVTKVLIKGWTDKEDSILLNHTHTKMKFLACGTFPYQGLNWCPLHWKADSTTGPPGKPHNFLFYWGNIGIQCCVCCRCCCCSVTKLCLTLRTHGLQPTRLLCPLSPRVCSNLCPLSWWCYLTISSSVALFSSCSQSFPPSESFPMNRLFILGDQSIEVSTSASVLPMNIQSWFPLGLTDLIFLQSNRLSRVFSSTTVQKH